MKRLTRSDSDQMVAGVLGGLAQYFHIDSNLLRLIFVILTFMSVFMLVLIYFAAVIIMPNGREIR